MYLTSWQIFAFGCVCGVVITIIVLAIALFNLITRFGVRVEREDEKEEADNGRL